MQEMQRKLHIQLQQGLKACSCGHSLKKESLKGVTELSQHFKHYLRFTVKSLDSSMTQ